MPAARVIVLPRALADFEHLLRGLAGAAGQRTADKYEQPIWGAVDFLAEFPRAGSPRPRLGSDIRIWLIHPYVVVYAVDGDLVSVMRILHGRRKITRRLVKE